MKTTNKTKAFDVIGMKNEIQQKIYYETKDMPFEELKNYLAKNLANDLFWRKLNTKVS